MKPLLLLLAATAGVARAQYVCEIPTSGCSNGMFNQATCSCECISPFCPDANGDCTNPTSNCGGNPWADCERGENCPWWVNPLKAESCTTGPGVPAGVWNIYNTKTACCNTNFAYSNVCDAAPRSESPTKHPTIARPDDDVYEVIPIKFDVAGLPDDVKMRDVKDEMMTVLKRILLRLADRIAGLKVSSVEEKVVLSRKLEKMLRRALEQSVSLYYNVYVVRDDKKKFGPLIIQEIRDSYDEVMEQIQTFTDTKYFGGDINVNWCTSGGNGKFSLCVQDLFQQPPPARAPTPYAPVGIQSSEGDGGLAGWAVALIVIFVLLLLACIGYFIFVSFFRDDHDQQAKALENNIYFDDHNTRNSYYGKSQSGQSRSGRSRRSRRSRSGYGEDDGEVQIVVAHPNHEEQYEEHYDDGSFTINTYGTKGTKQRIGRDPTMYIPGQEDKPDPDADVLMLTDGESGSRRYYEDPPIKPKKDPTQYYGGDSSGSRDPTYFVEGQQDAYGDEVTEGFSVEERGASEGYSSADPYTSMGDYDEYGFKQEEAQYMTSETNAEYARGRREPSYHDEAGTFTTQEPSVKSGRSKRSKKSRKSSRSGR